MRVLVVGPYPPTVDPVGAVVLRQVRELRRGVEGADRGDDVEVLSPAPSAAHHSADLGDPRGALALRRGARDRDLVIVHYTSDLVAGLGTGGRRTATCAVWRRALRDVPRIQVVIHRIDAGDDGSILELLRESAASFAVPDAGMAARLEARGLDLPGLRVDDTFARPETAVAGPEPWPADVRGLQATVQARAAGARSEHHVAEVNRLRASVPIRLALPTSSRPGLTTVRRVLQRLTAWEMDPVVGQVNRLRGAVLDLLDSGSNPPPRGGDGPGPGAPGQPPDAAAGPSRSGRASRTAARNDEPSTGQS
jgi:hypothetical protein